MSIKFFIDNRHVSRAEFRAELRGWLLDLGRPNIRATFQALREGVAEEFSWIVRDDEAGDVCHTESFHVQFGESV